MAIRFLCLSLFCVVFFGVGCTEKTGEKSALSPLFVGQDIPLTEEGGVMALRSSAFQEGQGIPSLYTCNGLNVSPPLVFVNLPEGTVSTALIMEDLDASQEYIHWVSFNLSPDVRRLRAGDTATGDAGTGTSGRIIYEGPCPPDGEHRYRFTLYALRDTVDPVGRLTAQELSRVMQDLIIETATLTGRYGQ